MGVGLVVADVFFDVGMLMVVDADTFVTYEVVMIRVGRGGGGRRELPVSRAKCFTIEVFPEDVGPSNKIARFEIKPLKIDLIFFSN